MKWGSRSLVAAVLVVLAATVHFRYAPSGAVSLPLFYNTTPSLPRGLYVARKADRIGAGDLVRVCIPPEAASEALARAYLMPGSCPSGAAAVGKLVAALEGDTVRVDALGVHVRGRLLPRSAPRARDSRGRSVQWAAGQLVLGPAECFVVSTLDALSYDSRYFGPVRCRPPHVVLRPLGKSARRLLREHAEGLR